MGYRYPMNYNALMMTEYKLQYKHKNCAEYLSVGSRSSVTSTGFMLDREPRLSKPMTPPPIHQQRSQTIYSHTNPFSDHDNRNDIQLKGEYMGNVSMFWYSIVLIVLNC